MVICMNVFDSAAVRLSILPKTQLCTRHILTFVSSSWMPFQCPKHQPFQSHFSHLLCCLQLNSREMGKSRIINTLMPWVGQTMMNLPFSQGLFGSRSYVRRILYNSGSPYKTHFISLYTSLQRAADKMLANTKRWLEGHTIKKQQQ